MKRETVDAVGGYVFPIGILAMLGTPAIWAYQILSWLRWGEWRSITVSDALRLLQLREPRFSWTGVQKISDFVMASPFSVVWFFLSLGLLLAFAQWADHHGKGHGASAGA